MRLTFVGADPLIGIQQQNIDGHSKQMPQLVALGLSQWGVALLLQHRDCATHFDAAQPGVGKLVKRSRHGHRPSMGRHGRRGSDGRV